MGADKPYQAFALVFALAFAMALALSPLTVHLGRRLGILDVPGGRHKHRRPVPRTGGLALYLPFTVAVLVAQILPVPRMDPKEIIRVTGLLLGGTFAFLVGLYDDRHELGPLTQYISQLIAGAIAIVFLIHIETLNNPLSDSQVSWPYPVTVAVTLFWMGLMMNTVNWLDGLDGLAGGVAAIAAVILFANAAFRLNPPQDSVSLLPLALLGATLGFLPFNFHPARVFMGTSGSMFLGYTLGALSIIGGAKMATILLVMGLPLLDVAWVIVTRLREGRNPTIGGREHLHFRLVDMGLGQREVVLGYYAFSAIFGALTLAIESRLFKLIALAMMVGLVLAGFALTSRRAPRPDQPDDESSTGGAGG